ncbi:MAG: helix-turn-helix domain-containing protein [Crocinitomicaceae bacterium]|nr:helix-turn-helix domain-containing protein [Crocinitomicaceae bacterium]
MFFASNLKLLRKRRKWSQEEVAQKLNLTRSSYSGYENGVAEPGIENLIALSTFYKVTLDDLLKRDLNDLNDNEWGAIDQGVHVDAKGQKLRVLTAMVNEQNEELIEMIPAKASAGYTSGYADPDYLKVLPTFQLPFLSKNKKYRSFPIAGDSMPPVSDGSYVVGEFLQNWEQIKSGTPYIVVTKDDGIVFKIVNKLEGLSDQIQLCSTNPLYAPYLVNINDVIEIWKFVNYIAKELPETKTAESDLSKSIRGLQKEVHDLKTYINHKNYLV